MNTTLVRGAMFAAALTLSFLALLAFSLGGRWGLGWILVVAVFLLMKYRPRLER